MDEPFFGCIRPVVRQTLGGRMSRLDEVRPIKDKSYLLFTTSQHHCHLEPTCSCFTPNNNNMPFPKCDLLLLTLLVISLGSTVVTPQETSPVLVGAPPPLPGCAAYRTAAAELGDLLYSDTNAVLSADVVDWNRVQAFLAPNFRLDDYTFVLPLSLSLSSSSCKKMLMMLILDGVRAAAISRSRVLEHRRVLGAAG
jgi:hypothetical protein